MANNSTNSSPTSSPGADLTKTAPYSTPPQKLEETPTQTQ